MLQIAEPRDSYGGEWTLEKLQILEMYLNAYTTALKNKPFGLTYIDAFAGTGRINLMKDSQDAKTFIHGSAPQAINISNRPFDKLIFIEKDNGRYSELQELRQDHPDRDIVVKNANANSCLQKLQMDWRNWRGVLFLDPFATEVEWSTIEKIAGFNALDTWLLFPTSAVSRILPLSKRPEDIDPGWVSCLNKIYGNESWRGLYKENPQGELFGNRGHSRDSGVDGLLSIYKQNLEGLFGKRFLQNSRTLRTSTGSPLFEFIFCAGNLYGADIAKRIAGYIIDHSKL